jgi:glycosyltransferase involved in cell wall biosynthesis
MATNYTYADIAIGITTYNRQRFVEACARSIAYANGIREARILVQDDCSSEYDSCFLKRVFPPNTIIIRSEQNSGGASFAVRNILSTLSESGAAIIVLLDSDFIISENFLDEIIRVMPDTGGFFSLFNTPSHKSIGARGDFVAKDYVGSVGTVWREDIARRVLEITESGPRFDWRFCDSLRSLGLDVLAVRNSLVQHLGFLDGQNSSLASFGDVGSGFSSDGAHGAYAILEEVLRTLSTIAQSIGRPGLLAQMAARIEELEDLNWAILNSHSWRLTSPLRKARRLLYSLWSKKEVPGGTGPS